MTKVSVDKPVAQSRPIPADEAAAGTAAILSAWKPGEPYWVFAYGSLMWNPDIPFEEQRPARLHGYHRAFCIYSHHYRGTEAQPGLVLGLDRGGSCRGICFRIHPEKIAPVTEALWRREMVTKVYAPRRITVQTDDGPMAAQTFVANPHHVQYAGKLSLDEMAAMIRLGQGVAGKNVDYLASTVEHMLALGIDDGPLHRLMDMLG